MAVYNKHERGVPCSLQRKDIYGIKKQSAALENFLGSGISSRYVCVYLLNEKYKYAFIYGCNGKECKNFKENISTGLIHKEAHKKAFAGNKEIYEWIDTENKSALYESTVIPLTGDDGKVENILGIVKHLTGLEGPRTRDMDAADCGGRSFIRILMNTREEEKRNISSMLHDEIGSAAVFINSLLSIVREDIKDGKKRDALVNLDKVQSAIDHSIHRIKGILVNLRPPQLEDMGLHSAVKELIDNISSAVRLEFACKYEIKDDIKISEIVKITLYRVVQEAINNVVKHARAGKVNIEFKEDGQKIFLTVKDNGKGFVPAKHGTISKLGLLGMKESLSNISGSVKITTGKNKGTTVFAVCPKIIYERKL